MIETLKNKTEALFESSASHPIWLMGILVLAGVLTYLVTRGPGDGAKVAKILPEALKKEGVENGSGL